jgi:hypothetical protein
MTKKDVNNNENIDRNKRAEQDWESHHTAGDRYPEDAKGIAETDVKNAHASGDGAMERNDAGLYNSENEKEKGGELDPPY